MEVADGGLARGVGSLCNGQPASTPALDASGQPGRLNAPVAAMVPYGDGYLMVGADGGIFDFSDQRFAGSLGSNPPASPITSAATLPR